MAWKSSVTIKGDKELKLEIDRLIDGNYRRAVRRGINSAMELAQTTLKARANTDFDRPTPYTLGAFKIKYASTANLEGKVYFNEPSNLSENQHYLYPNVYGVKRGNKKLEAALYAKGLLPKDHYLVPGKTTQLNQYGNVSQGLIVEILSYFQAFPPVDGYKINMTNATKAKKRKGTKKTFGYEFFLLKRQKGKMLPGIYRKVYFGESNVKVYLVFLFVNKTNQWYTRMFPFYQIVTDVVNRNFNSYFNRELEKIMSETIE
jgi:hypothetical protein